MKYEDIEMMGYTRREILQCLALGGLIIAGKMWLPGQKKIFIPTKKIFTFEDFGSIKVEIDQKAQGILREGAWQTIGGGKASLRPVFSAGVIE